MRWPHINLMNPAHQLGVFALVGFGLVYLINLLTIDRIAANHEATLRQTIRGLLPATSYDNDILTDQTVLADIRLGKTASVVYRARKRGHPVAAVLTVSAAEAYNGHIQLLVAISAEGILQSIQVVDHQETPGLGDQIESTKSRWLTQFSEHSLSNPADSGWKVKRDGGAFDQLAGATITSRSVVKAAHKALQSFAEHRSLIFQTDTPQH